MRIEINAGGISGALAIGDFQNDMASFITNAETVISSFKAVRKQTLQLNGGVDGLQDALDQIDVRIKTEETGVTAAKTVQRKTSDFLDLAVRVDRQVAESVNQNQDAFYRIYPWLKPVTQTEDTRPWYEKAYEWLCKKKDEIVEGVKNAWNWMKDTAQKAWDGLVAFYEEHKKAIATALMVIAAVAVLILVPAAGIIGMVAVGAASGLLLGAAMGGIAGGLASYANGGSFWSGFEDGAFSGAVTGLVTGAIGGAAGFAGQVLGKGISTLSTLGKTVRVAAAVTKAFKVEFLAFDIVAMIDLLVDPEHNPLYDLNSKARENPVYNGVDTAVDILDSFFGGMGDTMKPTPVPDAGSQVSAGTEGYGKNITFEKDPMSDGRYFSRGNYYDEYEDFWKNGGERFDYYRSNDSTVQMINARDIEGVYVFENDLSNPSQFWDGPGRYGQDSYREYFTSGKIQNTPVEVNKIVTPKGTFFEMDSGGRHRILTAQEMGVDIPAIVLGTYVPK